MTLKYFSAALFTLAFGLCVFGQQPPQKCHPEKSHDFDFWIGKWEVTSNGQLAGHNEIVPIMDGCAIQENWVGAAGGVGTSLNYYNPRTKQWEQFWLWRYGVPMQFKGNLEDGKMVLRSEVQTQNGKEKHRIIYTPNADGTVRQLWEKTPVDKEAWQTLFDGLYTKIASK